MADYETQCKGFSWQEAGRDLQGLPGGALNIAHETVDRHARSERGQNVAIRWLDAQGGAHDFSYARLAELTSGFASVLDRLGCTRGTRVFSLLPRLPSLYVTALGTLKHGSVFCPLFSAFGPEPIRSRLEVGQAEVLVTTLALYRRKVAVIRENLPNLRHVLLVDAGGERPAETHDYEQMLQQQDTDFETVHTAPEDLALLHFTSGTTGTPKAVMHVHQAVLAHLVSARYALDLRRGDVFWCTADPGWVTGTSYGIIAPLALGATLLVDEAEFDPVRWYQQLVQERVNVWYTSPTAVRMMMRAGSELAAAHDFPALRLLASVGEPLDAGAVLWSERIFGHPFHDNWWQTETGSIVVANYRAMDIKPGSMGKPLPGIEVALLKARDDGGYDRLVAPDQTGELAIRAPWPSMFRGYLGEAVRYQECFSDGWYLSGDLARRDEDGYYWFVGRVDDLIKSAGHLIGPCEVEAVLMAHPAVAEAGVIGKPDAVVGEAVKAFVALNSGYVASDDVRLEIMAHARKRLGAAVAPREIEFLPTLPKNRSGKIMRRVLKAGDSGMSEGDTSMLDVDPTMQDNQGS